MFNSGLLRFVDDTNFIKLKNLLVLANPSRKHTYNIMLQPTGVVRF